MLSGLTLPEDNLDHRGEKPREGTVTWRGNEAFSPRRTAGRVWKTNRYQLSKEEPLGGIWGG